MRFVLPLALAMLAAPVVTAQSPFWLTLGQSGSVGLDVARSAEGGAAAAAGFVTAHLALSARYGLVADVPLAQATLPLPLYDYAWTAPCLDVCDPVPTSYDVSAVGNPYLGLRVQGDAVWYQEIGVRLLLGQLVAADGDGLELVREVAFDRAEAFREGGVAVVALTGFERRVAPFLSVRARAGAIAQLSNREGAALIDGGVEGAWRALRLGATSHVRLGLGEGYQVSDGTWGMLVGAQVGLHLGGVRPALYARVPLGEASQTALGPHLGLSLGIAINR